MISSVATIKRMTTRCAGRSPTRTTRTQPPTRTLRRRTGARNRGLRDEDYYRGARRPSGLPKAVRAALSHLTMENIFGDDDEYDQCCEREYCRRMWACAGGRCQSWWSRMQRDLDRTRLLRDSQCNCQQMYRNDFKCPKVQSQPSYGQGSPCDGGAYYDNAPGYYSDQYGPNYIPSGESDTFDGTMFDTTEVFGGDGGIPTPATIPEANVDGA